MRSHDSHPGYDAFSYDIRLNTARAACGATMSIREKAQNVEAQPWLATSAIRHIFVSPCRIVIRASASWRARAACKQARSPGVRPLLRGRTGTRETSETLFFIGAVETTPSRGLGIDGR